MRAHFSMTTSEFVEQLRDIAIKANARPQVIYQIDSIIEAPSDEEIEDRIEEATNIEYRRGYQEGVEEGEQNKENAVEEACKKLYADICEAIKAKGKDIGLTDELVYKVVSHILWDCRP